MCCVRATSARALTLDGGRASDETAAAGNEGAADQTRAWAMASVSIYWRKLVIFPSLTVQTWA